MTSSIEIWKYEERLCVKHIKKSDYSSFVLAGDIGGTNTTIAICGIKKNKAYSLLSFNFQSKKINSLIPPIQEILEYVKTKYKLIITKACIAGAGPISKNGNECNLTQLPWKINKQDIIKLTSLKKIILINDFEAIAYGIINDSDDDNNNNNNNNQKLVVIKKGKLQNGPKAIIGPGTGLGKAIIISTKKEIQERKKEERKEGKKERNKKEYIVLPSEGGHSDIPIYNDIGLKMFDFFEKNKRAKTPLTYEDFISGRGIINLYDYLKSTKKYKNTIKNKQIKNKKGISLIEENEDKTVSIIQNRKNDPACKKTIEIFIKLLARCAKNFALNTLSTGGIYLAGGILINNPELLKDKIFIQSFTNNTTHKGILKNIPIYLVSSYMISIEGAGYIAQNKQ